MFVKIIMTCGDCDSWDREKNHCNEWNKDNCEESTPCCHGALTGMIPVHLKQPPWWLPPEVRALNQKLTEEPETEVLEVVDGDEKEES